MKAYGLPRHNELNGPDLIDIQTYGLKSSKSRIRGKCGDIRNSFRNIKAKSRIRRYWKKIERLKAKESIYNIRMGL